MDTQLPLSETGMLKKAGALKAGMAKLTDALIDVVRIASLVRDSADPRYVDTLFSTRAKISPGDVSILAGLSDFIEDNFKDLKAVSPFTIRALAEASDEVRDRALQLLRAGRPVDSERLDQIAHHVARVTDGDDQVFFDARDASREAAARSRAPVQVQRIQWLADDLIEEIEGFIRCYVPSDPQEGMAIRRRAKGYAADHRKIVLMAASLLAEFENIIGDDESLPKLEMEDRFRRAAIRSHRALKRFAAGKFGHDGGFAFEVGRYSIFSTEICDALYYLRPTPEWVAEVSNSASRNLHKFRSVELCAGAGGQAIGLMSAGFDHLAMFESMDTRAQTLRRNWPRWNVVHGDLRKVPSEVLRQYRGIDLLSGGPPCAPFSQANPKGDRGREDNLFDQMIRAVRIIRPRAFMFENVMGLEAGVNATYLAGICTDLEHSEPGYRVEAIHLNTEDYGLPQKRERLVIVGIRSDEPGEISEPLINIEEGFVANKLGPAIIRYETPTHLKDRIPEGSPQWAYDRWAEAWRGAHASSVLPTITKSRTEKQPDRLQTWADKRFDVSAITTDPPVVGDVTSTDFKPMLTVEAMAVAQGFPAGWKFDAKISGQIAMIGDAFPPIMAKAVGLRIFAALTGTELNLDEALSEPLLNEAMIGKVPQFGKGLLSGRLSAEMIDKRELVLRGEPIEVVEPDPEKRDRLLDEVKAEKRYQRFVEEQFDLREAILFPNGFRADEGARHRRRVLSPSPVDEPGVPPSEQMSD